MQLIDLKNITTSYSNRRILQISHLVVNRGDIIGNNGSGKTTLLKIVTGEIQLDQGNVTCLGSLGLVNQPADLPTLSGGEKQWQLLIKQFKEQQQLLLLDEPTTNLDQAHAMQLIQLLKRYRGTLLMIAHDQDLLDAVCQKIWEVVSPQVAEYEGNLTSYLCTKKEQLQWQEQQKQKRQLKKAIQTKVQKAQKSVKKPKGVGNNEAKNTKNYYQKSKRS